MAHEIDIDNHISKGDNVDRSHQYDVFSSDNEEDEEEGDKVERSSRQDLFVSDDEEAEDAEVDLEGEFLSALDELKNILHELKDYKKSVHEECSQLRTCLEDSNKKTHQDDTMKCRCNDLESELDSQKIICEKLQQKVETKGNEYRNLKDEVSKLTLELEKCQDELKLRKKYDGGTEGLDKILSQQKHSKDNGGLGWEEEEDAEVDLEDELLSDLDELKNIRNELKDYKKSIHEECSQLRTCLEDSNKKVSLLTTQLDEAKTMADDLKYTLHAKERRCEELLLDIKSRDKGCQDLKSEMEYLRNEYKLFENVAVVEQNRLIRCLEDSKKCISVLKTHQDDTMKCRCNDLESELDAQKKICQKLQQKVETKGNECHNLKDEVSKLTLELEKCQHELKLRKKYDGGTEALDKMSSQQKNSKDNGGL
ncbi:uncharacterized protein LOC131874146 [Cryptomeria japonica]|uniref:uncharacterized protein LOC131874146 n=1 Tax=Cryptomeria japonica TaxID=3369 RepID=UPI0027DA0F8B|nr:uncharacterized protein LOC131874146 [Cryptomeria japonica]